jgi:hypothetical protein
VITGGVPIPLIFLFFSAGPPPALTDQGLLFVSDEQAIVPTGSNETATVGSGG